MANREVDTNHYYWIKLPKNFFTQITTKKIKKSENGDKKVNIYIRMMLEVIDKGGYFEYQHIEDSIHEEIAIVLDEDAEIIQELSEQLIKMNLIQVDEGDYYFPEAIRLTGSETKGAERTRKSRAKKKEEQEALQCNNDVTESNAPVTNCNTEKSREEKSREEESKKRDRVNKEIKNKKRGEFVREGENNNSVEYLDMFRSNVGHDEKSNQGYSDFTGIVGMFNEICKSFEHIDNQEEYTETHSNIFIDCFNKGYSEEDYRIAFNKAENSDYLKGTAENNKKKNKPSELSWMLENLDSILSGKYDEYTNKKGKTA